MSEKTKESDVKGTEAAKKATAKTPKTPRLSNEALGVQLLKSKATEEEIIAAYTQVYKLKGITDKDFIKKRAKIYMGIATKRATK